MLMRFLPFSTRFRSRDIAVDLGTANTVLCTGGGEFVVSEPSLVAVDARTGSPLAAGSEALELLGREGIAAIRPLADGVIVDPQGAAEMLRHLISRIRSHGRPRPRVVASVSSAVNAVHRRAVLEVCLAAGAREPRLIAKPIAAALGSGLPVQEPTGSMVLDIGAGSCEVAVISMAGIVASRLIPVGGREFDKRIVAHLKRNHRVLVGERTAQEIKLRIGSASPHTQDAQIEIVGRATVSETLTSVRLTGREIHRALESPLTRIIEATRDTLARTPPQLACDIMDRGITLTGGSSLLHGLPERLRLETGMPVHVADSPCTCIAIGSARSLDKRPTRPQSPGDDRPLKVRRRAPSPGRRTATQR
jgi:rod shape-determining protein MreB and related proteins